MEHCKKHTIVCIECINEKIAKCEERKREIEQEIAELQKSLPNQKVVVVQGYTDSLWKSYPYLFTNKIF